MKDCGSEGVKTAVVAYAKEKAPPAAEGSRTAEAPLILFG